jgi:hypothetical protein
MSLSSKETRFIKKAMLFDNIWYNMELVEIEKKKLEEQIKLADKIIEEMDEKQADIVDFLKERGCMMTIEVMPLFDGQEVAVFIMTYKDEFIMYSCGEYAKAKCHPSDEYDPMIGYALCRNRLMEKLLSKKYNV